ncbi:MAG: ATP-dependent helicase [Burkholderiales bacterium]|nr:ATP-dependent helicase [Burkholderiales bacterium]
MKPTKQQQAIIDHNDGNAVVFAVAGAGKTTTMINRIISLIMNNKVSPKKVLATTFSRAARKQIQDKYNEIYKDKIGNNLQNINIKTLHGEALSIIKFYEDNYGAPKWKLESADSLLKKVFFNAQRNILSSSRISDGIGIQYDLVEQDYINIKNCGWESFKSEVSKFKGNLEFTEKCFQRLSDSMQKISFCIDSIPAWLECLIDEYERLRLIDNLYGLDDASVRSIEIFATNPQVAQAYCNNYDYIFVDEYQDVNYGQEMMLKFINSSAQKMMVIGDDDQTIYEWRGGKPRFIREKYDDPNWTTYLLDTNFRSAPKQIVLAREVISKNRNRVTKNMKPFKGFSIYDDKQTPPKQEQCVTEVLRFDDSHEQSSRIVELVQDSHYKYNNYENIVVLIRNYNETPSIETKLIENKIPYIIPGSRPFYQRPNAKVILDYMEVLVLEHQRRNNSISDKFFRRFKDEIIPNLLKKPSTFATTAEISQLSVKIQRSTSKENIGEILESAVERGELCSRARDKNGINNLISFFYTFGSTEPSQIMAKDIIDYLDNSLRLGDYILKNAINKEIGVIDAQIIPALRSYFLENTITDAMRNINLLREYHHEQNDGDNRSILKICTTFNAKGLEFPSVIIPNCNAAATEFGREGNKNKSEEEERRILYVAITRAIENIHIIYTANNPSKFLTEASYAVLLENLSNINFIVSNQLEIFNDPDGLNKFIEAVDNINRYQMELSICFELSRLNEDEHNNVNEFGKAILNDEKFDSYEDIDKIRLNWTRINDGATRLRVEKNIQPVNRGRNDVQYLEDDRQEAKNRYNDLDNDLLDY